MTRRFDIGPVVLAVGALVLLVALFLDWYATFNAWQVFEITDVILAALSVAAIVAAVGLLAPDVDYVDRRFVPWIVGAAFVLVADQILQPPAGLGNAHLGTGAWLAFAGSVVMVIGAVLSLTQGVLRGRRRRARPAPARERGRPSPATDRERRAGPALERIAAQRPARGRQGELMPAAGEVSFELERFEWTADDRLEVVGRWNGIRGRRIARPALTVEAGGRRQRLSGSQVSEEPWSASFAWSGDDIAGAELEIGRTLVVELPAPRRRRRRTGASAESDLRAQVEELKLTAAALRAERDRLAAALESQQDQLTEERDRLAAELEARGDDAAERDRLAAELAARDEAAGPEIAAVVAERDRLAAELAARDEHAARQDTERDDASAEIAALLLERDELAAERDRLVTRGDELAAELDALRAASAPAERLAEADQELAGLRLAHGSLRAAHEALEDELEELRGVRDERDELVGQIEQLKASAGDEASEKSSLSDLVRELQGERETLAADLAVAREEIARLERDVSERERSLDETREDAERRIESERATNTEIHSRLATAREETHKTIVAEAEETERLRAELEQVACRVRARAGRRARRGRALARGAALQRGRRGRRRGVTAHDRARHARSRA